MVRAAPLVVVALALAACGGQQDDDSASRFQGEERAAARVVEDLRDAAQRGDAQRLCSTLLSRQLVQRFEQAGGGGCAAAVEEAIRDADTFDLRVQSVDVQGDRATVRVRSTTGEGEQTDTLTLVREGGRFRIATLQAQA